MDWLTNAIFLVVSFGIGWFLAVYLNRIAKKYREIKRFESVKQALVHQIEEQMENIVRLHIRFFNDSFYAYDADTEEFYAQGSTLEQLVINLRENTKRSQALFVSSDEEARQPVIDFLQSKLGKNPTAVGVNDHA